MKIKKIILALAFTLVFIIHPSIIDASNTQKINRKYLNIVYENLIQETCSLDKITKEINFETNTGILIKIEKNVPTEKVYAYLETLSQAPEIFTCNLKQITLTTADLGERFGITDFSTYPIEDKSKLKVTGGAGSDSITINVNLDIGNTMIHELAHIYDKKHKLSKTEEFIKIFEEEASLIGKESYRCPNSIEYFAVSIEFYYYKPDLLNSIAPKTYKFLSENLPYDFLQNY